MLTSPGVGTDPSHPMSNPQKGITSNIGATRNKNPGSSKRKISDVSDNASPPAAINEKDKRRKERDNAPSDAELTNDQTKVGSIHGKPPSVAQKLSTPTPHVGKNQNLKKEKLKPMPNLVVRKKNSTASIPSASKTSAEGPETIRKEPHESASANLNKVAEITSETEQTECIKSVESPPNATRSAGGAEKPAHSIEQKLLEALREIQDLKKVNENLEAEIGLWRKVDTSHPHTNLIISQDDDNQAGPKSIINIESSRGEVIRSTGTPDNTNAPRHTPSGSSNIWPTPELNQNQNQSPRSPEEGLQDDLHASAINNNIRHHNIPSDEQMSIANNAEGIQTSNVKKNVNRPPPIIALNQSAKVISNFLTHTLSLKNYYIKRIKHNKHIINVENLADYRKTCEIMRERGLDFFSFTPSADKIKTMVIKGIDGDFSPEDILADLKETKVEGVEFLGVSNLVTQNAKKLERILPIFLIKITAHSNISNLVKIKRILHQSVSWEPLRKGTQVQCRRCQRIGHVAKNCNLDYRCVKCDEKHDPGQCKILQSDNSVDKSMLYCVHCKNHGHPASYRGCPKLVEYRKIIKTKIAETNEKRSAKIKKIGNKINPAVSYSAITASNSHSHTLPANHITDIHTPAVNPNPDSANPTHSRSSPPSHPLTVITPSAQLSAHLHKIQIAVETNASNIQKLFDLFNNILGLDNE